MAKALKVAGFVLGAVAVVATAGAALGVMMGGTMMFAGVSAATIATVAGGAAAVASSISQAIAKPPPARGSVSQMVISADAPQPYVMGEGYYAGVLRHRTAYGGYVSKVHNPYLFDAVVYSGGGPVQSLAPRVDMGVVTAYYSANLGVTTQLGACPEPAALAPLWAGAGGWGTDYKLSGQAAAGWSFKFDSEGKIFSSGLPVTGAYGQWVKVYDPRLDSTRPGGSGSQRLGNEATYTYSDNPALHAGTYAFGRYQNGKRTLGMGLPADAIDWEVIAAWANTCQANNWRIFGVLYEPADRWANLNDICAAGGAEPIPGALLSFRYQAPRVALDTITESDIADEASTVCAMQSYSDRVNIVVPKRLFPENSWELMSDQAVGVGAYIDADGEERPREWPFNFVKASKQARELAAYKLVDTRELFPIELVCIPRLRGYRAGDCLHLDLPQLGLDHDAIILHREIDPGTGKVRLTLMSESTGKHAFALGQAGAVPPTASLAQTGKDRDDTSWQPPKWSEVVDDDPAHPKPEDGATVGAPSGTEIGGVPVDQVLQDLAQLETDMATAAGVAADLQAAYGSTASAAASAAAAQAARDLAQGARDDAQAAVSLAESALDDALMQAGLASGSAGAAAGHASTASTKANEAAGSASAAQGSATVASTKAGEASTHASNAATSSSTAEGHKNAAAISAGVAASAGSVAQNALIFDPPNEIREDLMTYRYYTKSPQEAEGLTPGSVVAGVYTMDAANLNKSLAFKKVFPWVQGRIYEVSAVVEVTNMGGQTALSALAHFGRMNADYTSLSEFYVGISRKATPLGEKVTITARVGCGVTGIVGVVNVAECPHFRMSVLTCRGASSNVGQTGAFAKYHSFSVRDVTEQVAVELLEREGRLSQAKRAQYFMDGADGWGELYSTAATKTATQVPQFVTDYEGAARVLKSSNGRWNIASFETYPILPGRKYRVRHRLFIGGSPASTQTYTGFALLDAAGAFDSYRYTHSTVLGAGWNERDVVVNCDDILAARPLAAQLRLLAFHNYGAAVGTETAVAYFTIDDVTDAEAAKASATAASNSASSASASASTAGSQASTATTQAGIAATKAGEASTYASSAATSSSTAEGHKNAAASSAGVAATQAGDATNAAGAAVLSANTASTKATEAGNAATAAANSVVQANQAKDAAASSASVATGAASTATGAAASAQQSAVLSATIGQGALNKNAGFDDYPSDAVGAFPTAWTLWQGTGHYRAADPQGGYALRMPAAGGANVGVIQNQSEAQLLTANGYYVIEADVFLHAGSFAGAGVLFTVRSQTATNLENLWLHFNNEPDITGTVQSAPTVGRAYSFRKIVKIGAGDAKGFQLYAMTKHSGLNGGNAAASDIEWRKLLVRPATQAEVRDQTVLAPMQATVTNQASAISTIESSLASQGTTLNSLGVTVGTQASALTTVQNGIAAMAGNWTTQIDVNGRVVGRIKLDGTGATSSFEVLASVFKVVNPGGGAALTWFDGILWNKGASHSVIIGQNFGNQNNLLLWAGPNPASPSNATKSNGVFWIDNAGNSYFGGSLSAGVLKNAAQTTLYTKPAEVILGPFSTNGNTKSITLSYTLDCNINIGYDQPGYTTRPVQATIQLHRSIDGGAWTLIDTLTANGTSQVWAAFDIGSGLQIVTASGSKTLTNTSIATSNIRYRATLVNWKLNGVETALPTIPAYDSYGNQTISVICVEG